MKTWQKVGISALTVGVTATALYFGYKALKKVRAKKKAAAEAAAAKEKADQEKKETPAPAAQDSTKNETKQP